MFRQKIAFLKQNFFFVHSLKNVANKIHRIKVAVYLAVFFILHGCTIPATRDDSIGKPGEAPEPDIAIRLPFDYDRPNPQAQIIQTKTSRWIPVAWRDLPGWHEDRISEAWQAWMLSCSQASAQWIVECGQIIHLANASENQKRQWMYDHLQPYRVESLDGIATGTLTAYYEPIFPAYREPTGIYQYPLYHPPADLKPNKPYWSRKEIESLPNVQRALQGYRFAYLSNPLDVLILHIQGSGQLSITEPDGSTRTIRAAYAANNNHRYASVGRYLLNRNLITDGTWPGIRAWLDANPQRVNEVLWSNPRYIFFREETVEDNNLGPIGAQGVPLSYGRSIAVDRTSIPYGTPVWIVSQDSTNTTEPIQRLVLAQDTGSAIVGAVRADYFWGKGPQAGEQAGRTKQVLYIWTFLPRTP